MKFKISTIITILAVILLITVFGVEYYSYAKEQRTFEEKYSRKAYHETSEAEEEKSISPLTSPSTRQPVVLTSYEPSIGMNAQEVYDSSWGYPNDQTKTTTASGIIEMWVYPENNYIHFKDGKVVAINETR